MKPKLKLRIKREMNTGKPTIWIGKEKLAPSMVDEISRQLDKKEIVKIRVLKTALQSQDIKILAAKGAQETESVLIDVRGHTFILYKPTKKTSPAQ